MNFMKCFLTTESKDGEIILVIVEEVTPHDYRTK